MNNPTAVSMRHCAHCCPKCKGPIRLIVNTVSGPENHTAYCADCGWGHDEVAMADTELAAITNWNNAVRAATDTKGLPPEALPMSESAVIDACARVQGWIDYPSDSGEGAHTWNKDNCKAPFGPYLNKDQFSPLAYAYQANELAFTLRMILQYGEDRVTATTPELQSLGITISMPVEKSVKFGRTEIGVYAMQRAIAWAAARHFQHGFHLANTGDIQLASAFKDVATSDLRARAIATRTPCPECNTEQVEFIGMRPEPNGLNAFWRCRHCKHAWEREIDDA